MKSHTLYVNPVERESVQGRHRQVYTVISPNGEVVPTKGMKKTREDNTGFVVQFALNPHTGRLQTGLDELIDNPFKDREVSTLESQYSLHSSWRPILENLVTQDKITEQRYLEILAGVMPDYYTSEAKYTIFNWTGNLKDKPQTTFLQDFYITLYPRPNKFTSDTPRGRLALKLIKNRKDKIAWTRAESNSAIHEWFISEENEAERTLAKKRDVIKKANYELYKLQNESSKYINYQFAVLLKDKEGRSKIKGNVDHSTVTRVLDVHVGDEGIDQLKRIDEFNNLINMRTTTEGIKKFNILYLIQQAINTNIISLREGYYVWHSKSNVPNMYKHTDINKLANLLLVELSNYSPAGKRKKGAQENEPEVSNWYKDLLDEVKSKGIWLE